MTLASNSIAVIAPGSSIGILGSGQLGRMMAIAAKHMGYRVHIFSPIHDSPAGQVADLEIQAGLDDLEAVESFARQVDVVTVETENIPTDVLGAAAKYVPAYPGTRTLRVCQNRGLEKQFLVDNNIPTNRFQVISSVQELTQASDELMPGVLKTTTGGYDGKGQVVVKSQADFDEAGKLLAAGEAILEEWVDFDWEFSIVAARNANGQFKAYPSIRNEHKNGILDVSSVPSGLPDEVNETATKLVREIMECLDTVGVLTVEFFYCNGKVLVNEIAPRPHNSGHLTIEGHATNQFEQHIRAVCGLTAGSTRLLNPVAMANILGNQWSHGEPKWELALKMPNTKIHLYGKSAPAPNRKMGHLISFAESVELARENVLTARNQLSQGSEIPSAEDSVRTEIRS